MVVVAQLVEHWVVVPAVMGSSPIYHPRNYFYLIIHYSFMPVVKNKKYWSAEVTQKSNALDLASGVFTWKNPKQIAKSLKQSAEESLRRKGTPYQSAMSMLNFYINRAGKNLNKGQKKILEQVKDELRKIFNKNKNA